MSIQLMLALVALMVGTAFLSGIFGMAGGLILIGVLLYLLPLPEAMALHAVTQMASNGWRGVLWIKHVHWQAALRFVTGCGLAFGAMSLVRYVPPQPLVFLLLGLSPFMMRALPASIKPDPARWLDGILVGGASTVLMLLSGATGPLIDTFFLGGGLERRQIIATKAVCQVINHGTKFIYFGGLVDQAAGLDPIMASAAVVASFVGTSAARPILDRLSDTEFRLWANRIVTTIAAFYLLQGAALLLWPRA
jgi:uncharacterized protein